MGLVFPDFSLFSITIINNNVKSESNNTKVVYDYETKYYLKTVGQETENQSLFKGEFANTTYFISRTAPVQSGFIPSKTIDLDSDTKTGVSISSLYVMSDGMAEKMVSTNGLKVANVLSDWSSKLRENLLNKMSVSKILYSDNFTKGHTGDDCSIAMVSLI